VVSLERAVVDRFVGENSEEENFIYVSLFLSKIKSFGKKRSSIDVLPEG